MTDPTTAVGAAVGVAVALTPLATNLLKRALGPVADEVGEHWRSKVSDYFERNRNKTINAAAQMVEESGRQPKEVPVRLMLAFGKGASEEDSPELQQMWAALLANAAISDDAIEEIPSLYATILGNMTPIAARVLEELRDSVPLQDGRMRRQNTLFSVTPPGTEKTEWIADTLDVSRDQVEAAVDILVSQGLATRTAAPPENTSAKRLMFAAPTPTEIRITALGRRFLAACEPPAGTKDDQESASL